MMLQTLDGAELLHGAEQAQSLARGLDAELLAPTPPVSGRERRWARSLLDDEPALCAWLNRARRHGVVGEQRRAFIDGCGVTNAYPLVAVVVLSHNDRDMALRCLASIDKLTYRKGWFFVVLVENSTDPSQQLDAETVASRGYGFDTTLIRPDRNTGFAAGVNLAARYAFDSRHADYVLLLNDDALIPDASVDLVQELVAVSGLLPDVAAVGPKVYFERHPAGSDVIASAGASFVDLPPQVGRRDPGMAGIVEADFVVGVCTLISSWAWHAVGEFDARFFAYYEETEWSYRARQLGLKSYCVCDIHVLHGDHDREFHKRHRDPASTRLMARNQVLLAWHHHWFAGIVAERLTRKYRQLIELGEHRAADGMLEGLVLARRNCFPNFTTPDAHSAEITARAGTSENESAAIFFYMGRVTRRKGVDVLARLATRCTGGFEVHIRGISYLDPRVPEDNDYLHRLYATLKHSGALRRNAVTIYGSYDDAARESFLRRYAGMLAMLVHPAKLEGFGLVLLEAMQHGIPVVADRQSGLASSFDERSDSPLHLLDFGQARAEDLFQILSHYVGDGHALLRRRQRCRAYVESLPSARQMYLDYRQQFLAACDACGVAAPAITLLSGGSLYKIGGCAEWLVTMGGFLRHDKELRYSLMTLPGGDAEPFMKYREALKGLPWEEFRLHLHRGAPAPTDSERMACFRELIDLFAREASPASPQYSRTLHRFHQLVGRQDYWGMYETGFGKLVDWYMESRPGMSRHGVERGLQLLLRGYLLENLLPKDLGERPCVYAETPPLGLLAAVCRDHGSCGAYVLGMHSFTDLHYDTTIREWSNVDEHERQHFQRVVGNLLAYSVIKADLVICVSAGLEQHLRTRFADDQLPRIITIPNTLRTRAPDMLARAAIAETA
jgi:GT2 family glycosyltransferase